MNTDHEEFDEEYEQDDFDRELMLLEVQEALESMLPARIEATAASRWAALARPDGRQLIRQLSPHVDGIEATALMAVTELIDVTNGSDPVAADAARLALSRVGYRSTEKRSFTVDHASDPTPAAPSRTAHLLDFVHGVLSDRVRDRISEFAHIWTWAGVALTLIAAFAVAFDHLLLGAMLLAMRVSVSIVVTATSSPVESAPSARRISSRACVAGHLADSLMVLSVAAMLALHSRTAWAFLVICASLLQLGATLYRVSALQEGHWIHRSPGERLCRVGGMIAGLVATAFVQPIPSGSGVPLVLTAIVGGVGFALMEVWATDRQMAEHVRRRKGMDDEAARADQLEGFVRAVTTPPLSPVPVLTRSFH